jgi:hypothetical protein
MRCSPGRTSYLAVLPPSTGVPSILDSVVPLPLEIRAISVEGLLAPAYIVVVHPPAEIASRIAIPTPRIGPHPEYAKSK